MKIQDTPIRAAGRMFVRVLQASLLAGASAAAYIWVLHFFRPQMPLLAYGIGELLLIWLLAFLYFDQVLSRKLDHVVTNKKAQRALGVARFFMIRWRRWRWACRLFPRLPPCCAAG